MEAAVAHGLQSCLPSRSMKSSSSRKLLPVAATEGAASAAEINDKVSKLSLRCAAA